MRHAGNRHARLQLAVTGGKEECQVKKITIRKAGPVKLTGSVRSLYGGCVAA